MPVAGPSSQTTSSLSPRVELAEAAVADDENHTKSDVDSFTDHEAMLIRDFGPEVDDDYLHAHNDTHNSSGLRTCFTSPSSLSSQQIDSTPNTSGFTNPGVSSPESGAPHASPELL